MAVKHLLLGALGAEGAHGYRILQRLEALPGVGRAIDRARVYATLAVLERERLAVSHEEERRGRRPRRRFELTEAGRRELDAWLERPVGATRRLRRSLLARLAVTGDASAPAALRRQEEVRRRNLHALLAGTAGGRGTALERLARDRQRRQLEIEIELIAALLAGAAARPAAPAASSSGGAERQEGTPAQALSRRSPPPRPAPGSR